MKFSTVVATPKGPVQHIIVAPDEDAMRARIEAAYPGSVPFIHKRGVAPFKQGDIKALMEQSQAQGQV